MKKSLKTTSPIPSTPPTTEQPNETDMRDLLLAGGFISLAVYDQYQVFYFNKLENEIIQIIAILALVLLISKNKPNNLYSDVPKYIQIALLSSIFNVLSLANEEDFSNLLFKCLFSLAFYMIGFFVNLFETRGQKSFIRQILSVPFIIIGYLTLLPYVDIIYKLNLQVHVFGYIIVLGLMMTGAIYRYSKTTFLSFLSIFFGSICIFLANCLMLAHRLFHLTPLGKNKEIADHKLYFIFAIKCFFYAGSLLITLGTIAHMNFIQKIKEDFHKNHHHHTHSKDCKHN